MDRFKIGILFGGSPRSTPSPSSLRERWPSDLDAEKYEPF